MSVRDHVTWSRAVFVFLAFVSLLLVGFAWVPSSDVSRDALPQSKDADIASWCPVPDDVSPPHDGLQDSSSLFSGDEVLMLQVDRLASAVNVSTVSYDDNGDVDDDTRWLPFAHLHDRLQAFFPHVHEQVKLEKVNKYGLLYHLPGINKSMKPILFMAHQDVVPPASLSSWKYPPFEAHFDGQWLWGRGSADCKSNLIGLLSALEALLIQGFRPQRTIILSFGFDEETGGSRGAALLAAHLEDRLGPDSIAMIHDEGGMGVSTLGNVAYALPATAEKGFVDLLLSLEVPGGHSSRPPNHTAIGIMSKMIVALEEHPFKPSLDDSNPVKDVLRCEAVYSPHHVEPWLKEELAAGQDIGPKIAESRGDSVRWQIQTSQAVDVIRGGDKDNALPEEVTAVVNYRIAPHDIPEQLFKGVASLLAPIAHEHGIAVTGFGYDEERASEGILKLKSKDLLLPSPVTQTSPQSEVWSIFAGTLREVFGSVSTLPGVEKVVPVGSIATGNSDTSHYWNLTTNIFRFTPARQGTRQGVHTVDERMDMSAHLEAVRVYYDLMRNFQSLESSLCSGECFSL